MGTGLSILIILALASVLGVLALGLISMVRGGEFAEKHGNRLMRLRVILQFTAVILIVIAGLMAGR